MSGWISVKEQEPPEDVKILVAGDQYGGTYRFISVCEISHFTRMQDGKAHKYVNVPEVSGHDREEDFKYTDITHWMPLPKHPE